MALEASSPRSLSHRSALALAEAIIPGSSSIPAADERTVARAIEVIQGFDSRLLKVWQLAQVALDSAAVRETGRSFHRLGVAAQDRLIRRWELDPLLRKPLSVIEVVYKLVHFDRRDTYEAMGGKFNSVESPGVAPLAQPGAPRRRVDRRRGSGGRGGGHRHRRRGRGGGARTGRARSGSGLRRRGRALPAGRLRWQRHWRPPALLPGGLRVRERRHTAVRRAAGRRIHRHQHRDLLSDPGLDPRPLVRGDRHRRVFAPDHGAPSRPRGIRVAGHRRRAPRDRSDRGRDGPRLRRARLESRAGSAQRSRVRRLGLLRPGVSHGRPPWHQPLVHSSRSREGGGAADRAARRSGAAGGRTGRRDRGPESAWAPHPGPGAHRDTRWRGHSHTAVSPEAGARQSKRPGRQEPDPASERRLRGAVRGA